MTALVRWLQHNPEGIVVLLAVAAVGGVQFFRLQRRRRLMEDMPTARIRSAAQGYVELIGQALPPDVPLRAPLTGSLCAWYRFRVERRKGEGGNSGWEVEQQGVSDAQFWLDDGSGRCIVDPEGAEVRARDKRTWVGAAPQFVPESPGAVLWSGDAEHRYTEELILPGDRLYALGQFASLDPLQASPQDDLRERVIALKTDPRQRAAFDTNRDGELDAAEFAQLRADAKAQVEQARREQAARPQTHVLRKPTGRRIFLLSTLPPDGLSGTLRRQAWAWLAAGLVALGLLAAVVSGR
ncbi:GIDE domain-containing protein [Thiomonas sp.]|uniref:GIDE domain-containing protein n=1 Tax=Thiomonas sp. TaxID=2047785 RepID=UPI00258E46CE|nr:GIDE domain-containing protein [Thiomonas sp.]